MLFSEEGARFPKSIGSSGVWAGQIPLQDAWNLKEVVGEATQKSELERIGFLGDTPCGYEAVPLAAHFELHIGTNTIILFYSLIINFAAEQGPILEQTSRKVGIVIGGQAVRWYTITVIGRECHTGSTPFTARSDAMLCAAKIIVASNSIAKKHGGVASTGIIYAYPGSTNTVPGRVILSMDMRHLQDEKLDAMDAELHKEAQRIAKEDSEKGCQLEWRLDTDAKATHFHPDCIQCVKESAEATVGKDMAMEIVSGAGHDR